MRDIQLVLERWGQWAKDNSGVGYSPITAGFKGLLPATGKSKDSCCDSDGLIIDGAAEESQGRTGARGNHAALSLRGIKVRDSAPLENI